jgi:exosortase/archaeosortase
VIAQTHEELVKKIEDVKQTAVAQIQQPVVSQGGGWRVVNHMSVLVQDESCHAERAWPDRACAAASTPACRRLHVFVAASQPLVPPEEVVQRAQVEVQKLEAQAQAQAIAAVQVSAAAQRAEAEAQKHLNVHAQVAAQAQELQQKAVHLQVHAEQLNTTAAATEAAVVAASSMAMSMGMLATSGVSPNLVGVPAPQVRARTNPSSAVVWGWRWGWFRVACSPHHSYCNTTSLIPLVPRVAAAADA